MTKEETLNWINDAIGEAQMHILDENYYEAVNSLARAQQMLLEMPEEDDED
jgi:hypothetical protein